MTDNKEPAPVESAIESKQEHPGALLQRAREKAGISLREAADQLHLLPRQVAALEAGDYQQFNGEVFCKGYLRAYGKLLTIDSEMLVNRYLQLLPEKQPRPLARKSVVCQLQQPGQVRNIQYGSLAAFIAVVAVLWVQNADDSSSAMPLSVEMQAVVVDDNDRSLVQNLAPAASPPVIEPEGSAVAGTQMSEIQSDQSGLTAASNAVVTDLSDEPLAEVAATVEQKVRDLLSFHFVDDCWVEVTDSADKVIFANLKRAQDTLELSGNAPFRVLLGYAPGVSLDYNGEPVTINVNRKNQSALLVIGRL